MSVVDNIRLQINLIIFVLQYSLILQNFTNIHSLLYVKCNSILKNIYIYIYIIIVYLDTSIIEDTIVS